MNNTVVAIDLGGTNVRIGLVDESGLVLRRRRYKMVVPGSKADLYDQLAARIRSFLGSSRDLPFPVAVSVGFAGMTSSAEGLIYFAPNIGGLTDIRIGERLGSILDMPVFVANDADCAALGEYWLGAGKGCRSLFMITVGTGVGGGLVIDGDLWEGAHGIAGEIGHTVVDRSGPRCRCGNRGCLEAMASATAMVADYIRTKEIGSDRTRRKITAKLIAERARRGESQAREVMERTAAALGVGIANVFNLLDPEVIVIGGGVSRAGRILLGPAVETARDLIPDVLRAGLDVRRAALRDDAGLLGAAYLGLARAVGEGPAHSRIDTGGGGC
jgi:glucokinase